MQNAPKKQALTANTNSTRPHLLPEWLGFPTLAEMYGKSPEQTLATVATRLAVYQSRSLSAAPAEKNRARLIAQGLLRVQEVLLELQSLQRSNTTVEQKGL